MDAETTEPRPSDRDYLSPLLAYLRQVLKGIALQTHALPMLLVATVCGHEWSGIVLVWARSEHGRLDETPS